VADLLRYGAYVPRYRAPLPEIQSFFARPGRPRAKALATPGLDEDALTMAYEAAREAFDGLQDQLAIGPPRRCALGRTPCSPSVTALVPIVAIRGALSLVKGIAKTSAGLNAPW